HPDARLQRPGPRTSLRAADHRPGSRVRRDADLGHRRGRAAHGLRGGLIRMPEDGGTAGDVLTVEYVGGELGRRATLVQFSSAFCQPCRATRRILTDVAKMVDGVASVEVDAESRLDLVRHLAITGTPTVFVLDAEGRVVRRASGQPRKVD